MRNLYLLTIIAMLATTVQAQYITFNNVPPLSGGGNTAGGNVFNFTTNKPIILDSVRGSFSTVTGTVTVWYNPVKVNGQPTINTANGWVNLGSASMTGLTATTTSPIVQTVPVGLNLRLNPGDTIGIAIQWTGNVYPTTNVNIPTFTDGNVTIIADASCAFTMNSTMTTFFTPRQINGGVVYRILQAAPNNAATRGLVSPTNFSQGFHDIKVRVANSGGNAITSLNINWELNDTLRTPITWSGLLDTLGGSAGPNDTVITLGNVFFPQGTIQKLKVWTSLPNGQLDTVNYDDTLLVFLSPSLSGSYTVGKTTSDFPTLQSAISVLNNFGMAGPVTFVIDSALNGQVNIGNISGISSTNTLTIKGKQNTLTSTVSPVIMFSGASNVIVDSLNIVLNASTGFGVHFWNQSRNITISNCLIDVGTTSTATTNAGIVASASLTSATSAGNNAQYITIENNIINGGYYSISLVGNSSYLNNSGHIIRNNKLFNQFYYGVYLSNTDSVIIENNEVVRAAGRSNVSSIYYGIYVVTGRFLNISRNRVHTTGAGSTSSTYAIGISTSQNLTGARTRIVNNAVYNIQTGGSGLVYGIHLLGTLDGIDIFHNTVELGSDGTTGARRGINFGTAPSNINMRNNIFSLRGNGTGAKHCVYVTTTSASFFSNYNVLHMGSTAGTNSVGYWTTNRTTLADWQSASLKDTNSLNTDPVFTNLSNGNITPISSNIDNLCLPVGVNLDINGTIRSLTNPDPGAIEFTGILGDIAAVSVSLHRVSQCYGTNDSVKVTIRNVIGSTADFAVNPLTVVYEVTGPVNTVDSFVLVTGTLAPNTEMTLMNNNIDMSIPGNYNVRAIVRPNPINVSAANDTISAQRITEVRPILSVTPKTGTAVSPTDTFVLEARSPLFPAGEVKFTEICHWRGATGAAPAGGWPSYLIADDYVELMGVPNSDLGGYTMEEWTGTSLQHTVTFPAGTLFSPSGTMIIATGQLGSSVPSPSNFYYHSGNTVTHSSTGDIRGYIIKGPGGAIVDAVAFGAYTFPVASGVTSADWTGATTNVSSAGIRLIGPDLNNATNWVVESASGRQDPNIPNVGVPAPTAGTTAGFNWYYMGNPIDTNVKIVVGPYTVPGIYEYVAVFNSSCGFFTDTVRITATSTVPVTLASFDVMARGNDAELVWTTASELNNDRFEVERSVDGNTFEKIGTVRGKGTTSNINSYLYNDANALVNYRAYQTIYYRLKQIDFDGSSEYSKTVRLVMPNSAPAVVELFPNPNSGQFNLNITSNVEADLTVTVINSLGRKVHEAAVHAVQGNNRFPLQLNLPAGIYIATIQVNGETITRSFIVK